jgi:hypothetical protein
VTAKLSPVARLDAEDAYVQAAADCILARHPHAAWLAQHTAASMSDATLLEATKRLRAWLADPKNTRREHGV